MNEHHLRRLLRSLVLLSAPLPLGMLGAACGGSALSDQHGEAGASAGGAESGGSSASNAGASNAGASNGGDGGNGASAGMAGASAGMGGASGGSSGSGGISGSAGSAGTGGDGGACKSMPIVGCAGATVTVPKSCIGDAVPQTGAPLPLETCRAICNGSYVMSCSLTASDATSASVQCMVGCATGRRPAGFSVSAAVGGAVGAGEYLAEMARLEAASVAAFRILRDELRANGAPKKLVRAAARAARDEVRHARATGALARRYGAAPRAAATKRGALRSIEAMALENAVEGCVRETFGALLATRQAEHATDPVVRAAMKRIARDETQHAALSWRIASWLDTRLTPDKKRKVEQAKQAAARDLLSSVVAEGALSFAPELGLPAPAQARALAEGMQQALWS